MFDIDIMPYEEVLSDHKEEIPEYLNPFLEDETIKIGYKVGNEYTQVIKSFGNDLFTYFHKITLHENATEGYDIIITCFSDMLKIRMIADWRKQGWKEAKIKRILLLLRNDEYFYCTFMGEPLYKDKLDELFEKDNIIGTYLSDKSFANIVIDGPNEGEEKWEEIFKEIDENFAVMPFYEEQYTFERVIFDIVNNHSVYFLILCYDTNGEIRKIQYSNNRNLSDNLLTTRGAEIYRIDGYLLGLNHKNLELVEKLKAGKRIVDEKRDRHKQKRDFLQHIRNQAIALSEKIKKQMQDSEKYNQLLLEKSQYDNLISRIMNELELNDYYIYDYMKEDNKVITTLPPIKNISELRDHMKDIVEGRVTAEIEHKSIKNVEIYRKEFAKTEAKLREEYPYAEVGGQHYNRKHKFSTLRYKKDIE